MEIQTELLNTAHDRLAAKFPRLKLGTLANGDVLSMEPPGGAAVDTYLNRSETRYITVKFLSRNRVQSTAYDDCCAIANAVRTMDDVVLSQGQWTHSIVTTEPQEVGKLGDAHIYACVAQLHYMT